MPCILKCCPFCEEKDKKIFSSFQKLRQHMQKTHGVIVLSRTKANRNTELKFDSYGCPSCINTFSALLDLKSHIKQEHITGSALPLTNPEGYEIGEASTSSIDNSNNKLADKGTSSDNSLQSNWEEKLAEFANAAADNVHMLLNVDSKIHQLLAVSSIFIVQNRIKYDSPIPETIQEHLKNMLRNNRLSKIDPHLATCLKDIINALRDSKISKTDARIQLLQLSKDIDGPAKNVVLAVESLVPPLKDLDIQEFMESEITASFVHPLIQALFTIDDGNRVAKCANVKPSEADIPYRPDYLVDLYEQYTRKYTTCFGEIKGDNTDGCSTAYDFYRLAIFSKQQMDTHGLTDVLSFQTIGSTTTFFIMNHMHPSVYTITELATINIPRSLSQYHKIVSEFDQLLTIATIHQQIKIKNEPYTPTSTLSLDYVQHTKKTLSRKRKPQLGHIATNKFIKF